LRHISDVRNDLKELTDAITDSSQVTYLNLSDCQLKGEYTKGLKEIIKKCPQLTTLKLTFNYIQCEGLLSLGQALQGGDLKRLEVNRNMFKAATLNTVLKMLPKLEWLHISTQMYDFDFSLLSEPLIRLQVLDLSKSDLSDNNMIVLLEWFKQMPELKKLDLSTNKITTKGLECLTQFVSQGYCLQLSINLKHNDVVESDLKEFNTELALSQSRLLQARQMGIALSLSMKGISKKLQLKVPKPLLFEIFKHTAPKGYVYEKTQTTKDSPPKLLVHKLRNHSTPN